MSSLNVYVERLRKLRGWIVECSANKVTLSKTLGKKKPKVISVAIEKERDGTFTVTPCVYKFSSTISHFTYSQDEMRWARNKGVFFSLIKSLKDVGMWDEVNNKDFIVINSDNRRLNKFKVKNEFKAIIC